MIDKKHEMQNKNNMSKVIKGIALLGLFLIIFGTSYALFSIVLNGTLKSRITTARLSVHIDNESGNDGYGINFEGALPISDEEGLKTTPYTFDIVNDGSINASYTLYLKVPTTATLSTEYVKYNLVEDGETITVSPTILKIKEAGNKTIDNVEYTLYKIDTDLVLKGTTKKYGLQMWLDEKAGNNNDQDLVMGKTFETSLYMEVVQATADTIPFKEGSAGYQIVTNSEIVEKSNTIREISVFDNTKEKSGLYTYPDAFGGSTYYYRGQIDNNYVTFANKTWRIVRILEDGSLRLILNEKANENYISYAEGYNSRENLKYQNSKIKTQIEEWYNNNLSDYDKYIKTSNYCNDFREDRTNAMTQDFIKVFGEETSTYSVFSRGNPGNYDMQSDLNGYASDENKDTITFTPNLSCNKEDMITAKAALITADEAVLAGAGMIMTSWDNSSKYYYYLNTINNGEMLTMSPSRFFKRGEDYTGVSMVSIAFGSISYSKNPVSPSDFVPVITLKATATIKSGDGTSSNPYVIE